MIRADKKEEGGGERKGGVARFGSFNLGKWLHAPPVKASLLRGGEEGKKGRERERSARARA